jgi:hypothetical protein
VYSDTQLTLAFGWPGLSQTEGSYEIEIAGDAGRVQETTRQLLTQLQQGLWLDPDATGTLSERDTYDTAAQGFVYMKTDTTPFVVYIKQSSTSGDWSDGVSVQGQAGTDGTPGANGTPGILRDEYSIDIRHRDNDPLTSDFNGEYPVDRSTGAAGLMTRFYGEVQGTGSVKAALTINGTAVTDTYEIEAGTPVNEDDLSIEIEQGSNISFVVSEITGTVKWIWLKVDGDPFEEDS